MSTQVEVGRSSNTGLFLVTVEDIGLVWPAVEEIMQKHPDGLLEYATPVEVFSGCRNGTFGLWLALKEGECKGVVLTSVEPHSIRTVFHILWAGGDELDTFLLEGLTKLEAFAAKFVQANVVSVHGRRGWARKLKAHGYGGERVVVSKDVSLKWMH